MDDTPSEDIQPSPFGMLLFYGIVFGWLAAIGYELVVNRHDESDICERAAVEPKAFRDVLRACGLGEYRQALPDPNEED